MAASHAARGLFAEQVGEPQPQLAGGAHAERDGEDLAAARARPVASRCATRWVSVRVLPVPGPATISSGPGPWRTACACSGVSPASSASARGRAGAGARHPRRGASWHHLPVKVSQR